MKFRMGSDFAVLISAQKGQMRFVWLPPFVPGIDLVS